MNRLSDAERIAGLTDPLPASETILWQGAPDPKRMGNSMFHYRWLALYVVAAMLIVIVSARGQGYAAGQGLAMATLAIPCAALGFVLLESIGRLSARACAYTLTNRRLILKIGIAMDKTVSIPLSVITDAAVRHGRSAGGDIALAVKDRGGLNFFSLWPHVRPFRIKDSQPMLRALADVDDVAERVGDALAVFNAGGRLREAAMIETERRGAVRSEQPSQIREAATA